MLHLYQEKDASLCFPSRPVIFIGDSITRKLFFKLANILDPTLPTAPPDDEHKHSDHTLNSKSGTQLSFYWDPFLNSSRTHKLIASSDTSANLNSSHKPALLVLGSGLWYLRYSEAGGLPAWEANIERILDRINRSPSKPADEVILLPIEEVVPLKLSPERATSMRSSDIDAMNADLVHRINPPLADYVHVFSESRPSMPISFPRVFNSMLDPSQTEDGLHFSDAIIRAQANILLNLRCNDILPKAFPFDKTCCRQYPWPSPLHLIILCAAIIWGPGLLYWSHQQSMYFVMIRIVL
jgi:N-acetylneuraminate 9-O-acetyltransferase